MFHPAPEAFAAAMPALSAFHRSAGATVITTSATGFAAQTMVETETGWCPAGTLRAGSHVATLDGGFAEVRAVHRLAATPRHPGLWVPGGALGNCDDAILGAGQEVLLPTGPAEAVLDAAFALVPAATLAGHFGIRKIAAEGDLLRLEFAGSEVVWANSGLLLHCGSAQGPAFLRLDGVRAQALIGLLEDGTPFPGMAARLPVAA